MAQDASSVTTFSITIVARVSGCPNPSVATITTELSGIESISDDEFTLMDSDLSITGRFVSATQATGTYELQKSGVPVGLIEPPFICEGDVSESGTWTADAQE